MNVLPIITITGTPAAALAAFNVCAKIYAALTGSVKANVNVTVMDSGTMLARGRAGKCLRCFKEYPRYAEETAQSSRVD